MELRIKSILLLVLLLVFSAALISNTSAAEGCNPECNAQAGENCIVGENGIGKCVVHKNINREGRIISYPVDSCLPEKPGFMNSQGVIYAQYCFGKDKIAGNADDCGCSAGKYCRQDGACANVCSDGTLPFMCSSTKPLYCDSQGKLVNNPLACGCPADTPLQLKSGECSSVISYLFTSSSDFAYGNFQGARMGGKTFENLAAGKTVNGECSNPGSLTDEVTLLGEKEYRKFCEVKNQKPFEVDLGGLKEFNEVVIYFGYPYVLDYQLEYYDGNVWRKMHTGKNDFSFIVSPDDQDVLRFDNPHYQEVKWFFEGYDKSDNGFMRVVRDSRIKEGNNIIYSESIYNKITYRSIQARISFGRSFTGTKVRLNAINWQEGASIYEIEVYNKNTNIVLNKRFGQPSGEPEFYSSGTYTSSVLSTYSSSQDVIYSTLDWTTRSIAQYKVKSKIDHSPRKFAPSSPPSAAFLDKDYGNNLEYKYYGLSGTAP